MKLDYLGRSWRTVKFELGHNEIDDALEPELRIASDLVELFTGLGLPAPGPIPVMRADHQVAQKLHAVSEPGSERVRDLVDLQLLEKGEQLDLTQIKRRSRRRVSGSSATGADTPGHQQSRSMPSGVTCTRRRSRASTYSLTSTRPSHGPAT